MLQPDLQTRLQAVGRSLDIPTKRQRLEVVKPESEATDLWDDPVRAAEVMEEASRLRMQITQYEELEELLGLEGLDEADLALLEAQLTVIEQQALLSAVNDEAAAIVTIHAGTGGVDAQDWAEMLLRQYLRYIESGSVEEPTSRTLSIDRSKWKVDIIDRVAAEEAGIKRVEFEVKGAYAYGLLKAEAGVHRLVRLSPFNAKSLRQTSFALIEVIPEIERAGGIVIDEKELRVDVFRSGGHGGQGVNTTDSAVRLTHLPTGLVVTVQNERSQHQNKATAMTILRSRLARLQDLQEAEKTAMLKGEFKEGSWGNQIRSYVLQPYQMVKDHRTGYETSNVQRVLDGDLGPFISAYLTHTDDGN